MSEPATASTSEAAAAAAPPPEPIGKDVVYCGVCTLPPEYCEFGGTVKKCEEWLHQEQPEMHQQLYSSEAIESKLSGMTIEAQEKANKDLAKKQVKEEARLEREAAKKKASIIHIKRVERAKRKHIIIVSGIENFGLDIKKTAKDFGKKFACGSSVTKSPEGKDEITVQGDVSDEIYDELVEKYKIDDDNIKQVEEKKSKG